MPNEIPEPVAAPAPESVKAHIEAAKEKAIEPPVEAAPVVAAPPVEKTGSALAKLALEQRKAREAMERVKVERASLEKELTEKRSAFDKETEQAKAEVKAFQEMKAQAKRYPMKALEFFGIDAKMVNEAVLNDGEPTANLEVQAVRDELAKLRTEQEDREKRFGEERKRDAEELRKKVQAQEAEQIAAFQAHCVQFVNANAEKFELISSLDQQHLVFQTIDETFRLSSAEGKPRLLTVEEAAEEVEKSLEAMAEKATRTKKFTAKQSTTKPPPTKAPPKPTDAATKTLSNTSSAPSSTNGAQGESWAQRKARVYAKLNSQP